jgi:hypothetical protein
MYGIMAMGLQVNFLVMCVCVWALDLVVFVTSLAITKWLVITGGISLIA